MAKVKGKGKKGEEPSRLIEMPGDAEHESVTSNESFLEYVRKKPKLVYEDGVDPNRKGLWYAMPTADGNIRMLLDDPENDPYTGDYDIPFADFEDVIENFEK